MTVELSILKNDEVHATQSVRRIIDNRFLHRSLPKQKKAITNCFVLIHKFQDSLLNSHSTLKNVCGTVQEVNVWSSIFVLACSLLARKDGNFFRGTVIKIFISLYYTKYFHSPLLSLEKWSFFKIVFLLLLLVIDLYVNLLVIIALLC